MLIAILYRMFLLHQPEKASGLAATLLQVWNNILNFNSNRVRPFGVVINALGSYHRNFQSFFGLPETAFRINSGIVFNHQTVLPQNAYFGVFSCFNRSQYEIFSVSPGPVIDSRNDGIDCFPVFRRRKPYIILMGDYPRTYCLNSFLINKTPGG